MKAPVPRMAQASTQCVVSYLVFVIATIFAEPQSPVCERYPDGVRRALWGSSSSYDRDARPALASAVAEGTIPPESIATSLQVNSLIWVYQSRQEFTLYTWERVVWYDRRLQYNRSCLIDGAASNYLDFAGTPASSGLWTPELYVENLLDEEQLATSWWLRDDGQVWWSRKVIWRLRCAMDFHDMPYDTQKCSIRVADFRHNGNRVRLTFYEPAMRPTCGDLGGDVEWRMVNGFGSRPSHEQHGALESSSTNGTRLDFNLVFQGASATISITTFSGRTSL